MPGHSALMSTLHYSDYTEIIACKLQILTHLPAIIPFLLNAETPVLIVFNVPLKKAVIYF